MRTQPMGPSEARSIENRTLIPELRDLYNLLVDFKTRFALDIPTGAIAAIETFVTAHGTLFSERGKPNMDEIAVLYTLLLSRVRAQVDYFLADKQARARRAVARAFTHLQRSLVADEDFRMKWQKAFKKGEETCEKLGAVHLLLHGIWAFKADAKGGKTDLVLREPVRDEEAVSAADAMVLTEWKRVRGEDDAEKKAMEAFHQAEHYARGTLAGFELSSHRYLVLVSEDSLPTVPQVPSPDGRTYEVRNIAVAPSTPSVAARGAAQAASPRRATKRR
ncbi:hypothetical protein [Pyxidicoccus sp. MSG2]|uniref:hypothetical protein n=1 Tax=Pyxidicoccus sp. MSG2 TaxID=2996790 RepID=UPI0022715202|nr:hypothetical protein [Pyxidicoccus sp. MSG2]MCY1023962.1 hypothetical protein [Pyxidicoccus sp. MSG2]